MAEDLTQVEHLCELGYPAKKLNNIADAIENQLSAAPETPKLPTGSGQRDP